MKLTKQILYNLINEAILGVDKIQQTRTGGYDVPESREELLDSARVRGEGNDRLPSEFLGDEEVVAYWMGGQNVYIKKMKGYPRLDLMSLPNPETGEPARFEEKPDEGELSQSFLDQFDDD